MTGPDREALLRRLAQGLDIPAWILGVGHPEPVPRTRRERAAVRVGDAGWHAGNCLVRAAGWAYDHAPAAANRITDITDWLANRIAGRR